MDKALIAIRKENEGYLVENPLSTVVPFPDGVILNPKYRAIVDAAEKQLGEIDDPQYAKDFPLKHSFAEGIYMREISVPRGCFLISELHREAYFSIILTGSLTMLTENGIEHLKAPCTITSLAGTKRMIYASEDFSWITVHPNPTNSNNIEELEERIHVHGGYKCFHKAIDLDIEEITITEDGLNMFFQEFTDRFINNEEKICQD